MVRHRYIRVSVGIWYRRGARLLEIPQGQQNMITFQRAGELLKAFGQMIYASRAR